MFLLRGVMSKNIISISATALCYNSGHLRSGFKGLNINFKLTKLSKNPDKNIISQIIHKAVAHIILLIFKPNKLFNKNSKIRKI